MHGSRYWGMWSMTRRQSLHGQLAQYQLRYDRTMGKWKHAILEQSGLPLLGGNSWLVRQTFRRNVFQAEGIASTETLRKDHIWCIQGTAVGLTEPEKSVQGSVVRHEIGEEVGDMMVFGCINCGEDWTSLSVWQEAIRGLWTAKSYCMLLKFIHDNPIQQASPLINMKMASPTFKYLNGISIGEKCYK